MPRFLASSRRVSLEGFALFVIFMGTCVLSLRSPSRAYLIPYTPYIMLALQLGASFVALGGLRLRLGKTYKPMMMILSLLVFLTIWSLGSASWSLYPELVIQRSLLVFVPLLLVFLLTWSDPNPRTTFVLVSRGLVLFVSLLSAVGVFLYFFGTQGWVDGASVQVFSIGPISLAQRLMGVPPFLRISSLTGNPNTLALWLAVSLVLTLYLLHSRRISRSLGILVLALQGLALLFTFSRTGIITSFIGVAAYSFWMGRNVALRRKQLVSGVVLLVLAIGVFVARNTSVASSFFDLNLRNEIWTHLFDSFREKPIRGVGFGVSSEAVLAPSGIEFAGHNGHLQILVEIGLPGYLAFLVTWLMGLTIIRRRARKVYVLEQRMALAGISAILASLLIHQLAEGSLLRYGFITIYWGYLLGVGIHPEMQGNGPVASLEANLSLNDR